jgi:dihydroorotase
VSQFSRSQNQINQSKSLPETLLIKNIKIVNGKIPAGTEQNVIIEKGKITEITPTPPQTFQGEILEFENAVLFPGFYDMHVHLREPGREDEETITSGCLAAANGGFTGIACMPNTEPAIDTQEVVNYIKELAKVLLVDVHPIAAVTKARAGKELAPIAELVEAGAVAISDDGSPVMNAEIMRRALEYSKMFGIPVLGHEEDINLSRNCHMHEGIYSTKLGIPGIPSISEEILIARDIMLTDYTKGRFHVCHISTAGSVELVRQAKEKGIQVTCEATPHHFTLTDQAVESFDTNTKMNPPLRSEKDRHAIIEGLKDGTIDAIATDHAPHSIEEKQTEYIAAPFGITGLETAIGLIFAGLYETGVLTLEEIFQKCVENPRKILNLNLPEIKKGEQANMTIVDTKIKWKMSDFKSFSRSKNNPFPEHPLSSKNVVVINNNQIFYGQ